jgi:hypothetical protein
MSDQRIEKWRCWCDGPIKNDVITMHARRFIWHELQDVLKANSGLPESYWWSFMKDTYATTQSVAVRRQADTHKDANSLGKLISEIKGDAAKLTRDSWIGLWSDADELLLLHAQQGWDVQWAGSVGGHLDPSIPEQDLDRLTTAATAVRHYVDKQVAHSEANVKPAAFTLTVGDVHEAIDVIGELFKKYFNLLTASNMVQLVPVMPPGWKAVFAQAWMTPPQSDAYLA